MAEVTEGRVTDGRTAVPVSAAGSRGDYGIPLHGKRRLVKAHESGGRGTRETAVQLGVSVPLRHCLWVAADHRRRRDSRRNFIRAAEAR